MIDKYYESPRWSGEIADCSMPMTFDTYSNCSYGCVYCFSQYQRGIGNGKDKYLRKEFKPVNIDKIKKMFLYPDSSQFGFYIKNKMTMQWGGLSDQFDEHERNVGVTLELLRFFKDIDYPICFSTKGTWWLNDGRYVELFKNNKSWNCKFSIITLDTEKSKLIERGVPNPKERLKAIEKYAKLDAGGATLRLRPFIIGVSNPTHKELIKESGACGATAVSTEFFCFEQRSNVLKSNISILDKTCGFNVSLFYKKYSNSTGYLRLNRDIKRDYVNEMEESAKIQGMRFYVSDAHFKERCNNGSCCGLAEEWNYSRGQFCQALILCKKQGFVKFGDISNGMEHLKSIKYGNATGFNAGNTRKRIGFINHTLFDYMRWLWNNPKSGQSPYTLFEGIMKPSKIDQDGNIVYIYDKSRQ